ncbi:MAG: helix-turn-helix transcriptional regulator [Sphingomonas sp.]
MGSGHDIDKAFAHFDIADGPPLVAFWGKEVPESDLHLHHMEVDWHSHVRGQLFYVEDGFVRVETRREAMLYPQHRLGWMPPYLDHKIAISGTLRGWGVLLRPDLCECLPAEPCVMGTSSLLRALVERAAAWADPAEVTPDRARLIEVMLDEIRMAPRQPLHLPMPRDPRALRIAERLVAHPGLPDTLEALARWAGLSERTARRVFHAETGMHFGHWRQQNRLGRAMERLARGEPVSEVADAVGYASPSNFIAMFRRAFGESPARFFANRGAPA